MLDLKYILIKNQVADGLTKTLPKDRFLAFRNAIGLEDSSNSQKLSPRA